MPLRVLVVDDDITVGMLLSMAGDDIEVSDAPLIGDALGLLTAMHFDAMVVDRRLPDGDGLDFVTRVRSEHAGVDVPIIVLTAWFDDADRAEVLTAGADDYLGKPIEPSELVAAVGQAIAKRPTRVAARAARLGEAEVHPPPDPAPDSPPDPPPDNPPDRAPDSADLTTHIDGLHAKLVSGTETIGRLTRENTELMEQAIDLQTKLTSTRVDNRRLTAELAVLREQVHALSAELEALRTADARNKSD